MTTLVQEKLGEIARLCTCYRVARLELFGSSAGETFDPRRSDVDLLVEFLPLEPGEYADTYFGLLEALEALLGRPVDLVMLSAVRNPYFLKAIERTRTVLYAA